MEMIDKKLREVARKKHYENMQAIRTFIQNLYGVDNANMIFDLSKINNGAENFDKLLNYQQDKTELEFFNRIIGIDYFLNERNF